MLMHNRQGDVLYLACLGALESHVRRAGEAALADEMFKADPTFGISSPSVEPPQTLRP
ncbi:hypothetical protein [Tessaracoccus flavescens]|uniref:hypothetical protein n=1 Tax=Tessaracoccus flavescens TaxID=399497 RepID=UPI0013747211|nr:hypothetical protein [Tessaracoccus flavescens]